MKSALRHALKVLEYSRIRDILSSYAVSAPGKERAVSMRPLRSIETARRHLAQTDEMRALLKVARVPLAGIRDVVGEISSGTRQGHSADPQLLFRVVDLLVTAAALKQVFEAHRSALPELQRLTKDLDDLPELREEIRSKLDSREGVRDEASQRLSEVRSEIRGLRASLRDGAARFLADSRLRSAFQNDQVVVKRDRYLVAVKAEYRSWVRGPIRERSQSGSTLYVEPEVLAPQGDKLLDALDEERDEVERILWELTRRVLGVKDTLRRLQEALSWVDFTCAKACFADTFGLTSPVFNDEGLLDLRDVRHPYLLWLERGERADYRHVDLEELHARVVPISVRLGDGFRVLVVTGPNTGGKTVALKTIGLTVLMALSGVPIPAAPGSRVPWLKRVFADIGDEQSLEQSLSTFSSHLTQVIDILREADENSLILLDEVGSGTDPLEGAALGKALLDTFLARGWQVIITTHIGSLKEFAYTREGVENAAMEFDSHSLKPTYRMLLGVPGSSNALAIARRMGLDEKIVAKAEQEVSAVQAPTREVISRMEASRRRAEKERRRTERIRRRAQGDARTWRERLEEVEVRKAAADREAQLVVDDTMREARQRLCLLVEQLKNVPKTHRQLVDKLAVEVDRLLVATPLGEKRDRYARSLKKGDDVYVPGFRATGKVKKIDKGNRRVTVLVNGIPVEISFDDVSWTENPGQPPETKR